MGDLAPCPWLSPLRSPTGLPHPRLLEKGSLVPAGAGRGGSSPLEALGRAVKPLPAQFWKGREALQVNSISPLVSPGLATPRGSWDLCWHHPVPSPLCSGDVGGAGWDPHEMEEQSPAPASTSPLLEPLGTLPVLPASSQPQRRLLLQPGWRRQLLPLPKFQASFFFFFLFFFFLSFFFLLFLFLFPCFKTKGIVFPWSRAVGVTLVKSLLQLTRKLPQNNNQG